MNSINHSIKKLIHDLYTYKYTFFRYQLLSRFLTVILLLPLCNTLLLSLVRNSGYTSLTNSLITKFVLSPQGLISMIILFIMSICIILIEIGGIIVLSHEAYREEVPSSYYSIIKYSLSKFPKMFGVGGVILALYILLFAPLLGFDISSTFLSKMQIPGFIMDVIKNNTIYYGLLIIASTIAVVFSYMLFLTLHYIILKGKSSKEAVILSIKAMTKNVKLALKHLVAILFLSILIILLSVAIIGLVIFAFALTVNNLVVYILLIILFVFIVALLIFIVLPLQVHILTMLFYRIEPCEVIDIPKRKRPLKKHVVLNTVAIVVSILIVMVVAVGSVVLLAYIPYDIKITAHRGSSTIAPENTLAAIKLAIDEGADFVEIDVQELGDGTIVVMHDKKVDRTTNGSGYLWDYDIESIKELDAGSWFSDNFNNEKVPTLQEVIDLSKGKIKLNIELKSHKYEKNLVSSVIKILKDNQMIRNSVVTSLEYDLLEEVEQTEPFIKTGYIMYISYGNLEDLVVDFYSIEETSFSEKFVSKAHNLGKKVHTWTINDMDKLDDVLMTGVDNVITDHVLEVKDFVKASNKDSNKIKEFVDRLLDELDDEK